MVPVEYKYKENNYKYYNLEIIFNIKTMRCQRFEGMSPVVSLFDRILASVLSVNVSETSCKNPLCPSCKQASPLAYFLSLHL